MRGINNYIKAHKSVQNNNFNQHTCNFKVTHKNWQWVNCLFQKHAVRWKDSSCTDLLQTWTAPHCPHCIANIFKWSTTSHSQRPEALPMQLLRYFHGRNDRFTLKPLLLLKVDHKQRQRNTTRQNLRMRKRYLALSGDAASWDFNNFLVSSSSNHLGVLLRSKNVLWFVLYAVWNPGVFPRNR